MHGGTGCNPVWTIDAAECRFHNIETFSFDVEVPYTHEGWRYVYVEMHVFSVDHACVRRSGRMRAMGGVAAALSPEEVRRFDNELAELLREKAPQEPLLIPHRVWVVIATRPGAG